jgi:hypothetical protein
VKKIFLRNIAALVATSLCVAVAVYAFNLWALSSSYYLREKISLRGVLFFEGLVFIFLGVLFMLGRGGINRWSIYVAVFGSFADALYGQEGPGPAEILRRDAWKARGFIRFGLVLIITGIILLVLYFLL